LFGRRTASSKSFLTADQLLFWCSWRPSFAGVQLHRRSIYCSLDRLLCCWVCAYLLLDEL
jgi:hypothetical protein